MTLSGKPLVAAIVGASLCGVAVGTFASGWRSARGLPPLEVAADAGVHLQLDAGVASRADCAASVEHWNTVTVPGPTRYVYVDGGVRTELQTVTVLVPDIRLTGTGASSGAVQSEGEAAISSRVVVAPSEPERHWEAGPAVLYGVSSHTVLWGAQAGWSGGPLGVRLQAMKGPGEFYGGAALVWRW